METHGTTHMKTVTKIYKLLLQWIHLYPSEFYRPASLLVSALSLEISSTAKFARGRVWCTTESHRQAMCVDDSHTAQLLIKELYANLIILNPVDS